jgi:8-oxo-dGTP pyrophosphatase MutT (NUDIX family)
MHRVAVGFLQLPNGKLVCQVRSNIPNIADPGSISGFGGSVESGEIYEEALMREFKEELDLDIASYGYVNIGKLD